LLENIRELAEDRTCIIISNRVSDVRYSDMIVVLDNGRIVERGRHEELVNKSGVYGDFYRQQARKVENESILD